ncbi:hypothetical protein P3339_17735 [Microbulbifer sp. MLAF003]|uniref:hypothetical protein n=1 Tax=unclassified Microbulbifer TaxID=2619833 RepID=UPI0024ADBA1C|nr:hypothetical protein [Microbulbifer sp. MLAF003]WHI50271.1 hypothetical protein P3339_17735 [Microbulbifer sp. MLAF003]
MKQLRSKQHPFQFCNLRIKLYPGGQRKSTSSWLHTDYRLVRSSQGPNKVKNLLITGLILFSMVTQATENVDVCPNLDLDIPESKAKPTIKTIPVLPKGNGKYLPACIVVSFELAEIPKSEGRGLIPRKIKIEGSSNKAWDKPMEVAVSRWLYLSKGIEYRGRQYVIYKIPAQAP